MLGHQIHLGQAVEKIAGDAAGALQAAAEFGEREGIRALGQDLQRQAEQGLAPRLGYRFLDRVATKVVDAARAGKGLQNEGFTDELFVYLPAREEGHLSHPLGHSVDVEGMAVGPGKERAHGGLRKQLIAQSLAGQLSRVLAGEGADQFTAEMHEKG